MTCIKCDHDLAECTCPDAAERIEQLFTFDRLYIGPEYKARLEAHAKKVREEKELAE